MILTGTPKIWHITFDNYRFRGFTNTLGFEAALGYWGLCSYNWRENLKIYRVCPEMAGTVWNDEVITVFVAELDETECVQIDEFFKALTISAFLITLILYCIIGSEDTCKPFQ